MSKTSHLPPVSNTPNHPNNAITRQQVSDWERLVVAPANAAREGGIAGMTPEMLESHAHNERVLRGTRVLGIW